MKLEDSFNRVLGRKTSAEKLRRHKFMRLTGEKWNTPPNVFCREKTRIHPKFIGKFYGENNIKKCAVEIQRIEGYIAFRFAWRMRKTYTWDNQNSKEVSNGYHGLVIDGVWIGSRRGLFFKRASDGRFYLGYKGFTEVVMKKV